MTNRSEERSPVISYAVWFRVEMSDPNRIADIFADLGQAIARTHRLLTDNFDASNFQDWYRIGESFYVLHIEEHWSPGDLAGFIRGAKLIQDDEEVMAVRIDRPDFWYIPHQGLSDPEAQARLTVWKNQAADWYYVRRN